MSKKTEASAETKLLVAIGRVLHHHLTNHSGPLRLNHDNAAVLAEALAPFDAVDNPEKTDA